MIWSLIACVGTDPVEPDAPSPPPTSSPETSSPAPAKNFTLALWMAADNDLEPAIEHDFDELEAGARSDLNIVVQVDGSPGFLPGWEGTKRFEIVPDEAEGVVSLEVADLGEVNSGDGAELADFLLWANENYPAEHFAVLMWNHGGGFWIASDDTSDDRIQLDDGELQDAIQAVVDARGERVDTISFDACNMAQWENGYALRGQVRYLAASQAWVGMEGYDYAAAFDGLSAEADGLELATALATSAMENGEHTHSVIDLDQTAPLAAALDGLAVAYLADPARLARFRVVLDDAAGLDPTYEDFWTDLGSLAELAALDPDPEVADAAFAVLDALDAAVAEVYNAERLSFASGLTIYGDLTMRWLDAYQRGPWAADTQWDELLLATSAL